MDPCGLSQHARVVQQWLCNNRESIKQKEYRLQDGETFQMELHAVEEAYLDTMPARKELEELLGRQAAQDREQLALLRSRYNIPFPSLLELHGFVPITATL